MEYRRYEMDVKSTKLGIGSIGAAATITEAKARLAEELDRYPDNIGGIIYDYRKHEVIAVYNDFPMEEINPAHRGNPKRHTTPLYRQEQKEYRQMLKSLIHRQVQPET